MIAPIDLLKLQKHLKKKKDKKEQVLVSIQIKGNNKKFK
jgi:hypothetical protein